MWEDASAGAGQAHVPEGDGGSENDEDREPDEEGGGDQEPEGDFTNCVGSSRCKLVFMTIIYHLYWSLLYLFCLSVTG